jgi:hypothetical protein
MTLSIINTQHNNALHSAESRSAECCIIITIILSVIMLSGVMLSVELPLYGWHLPRVVRASSQVEMSLEC